MTARRVLALLAVAGLALTLVPTTTRADDPANNTLPPGPSGKRTGQPLATDRDPGPGNDPMAKADAPKADAPAQPAPLEIGKPAPRLTIAEWVKGEPVPEFKKGRAYVVEYWATWCVPCIRNVPHLAELQEKYKSDLTVIGISSADKSADVVHKFMEGDNGKKMTYTVAIDSGQTTSQAYMGAVGATGIPYAFVVDKAGNVAWHGHPADGMDEVVEGVTKGTFDARKYADDRKKFEEAVGRLQQAAGSQNWDEADKILTELTTLRPTMATQLAVERYTLLSYGRKDKAASMAYAKKLADGDLKTDPKAFRELVQRMIGTEWIEGPDLDYTITLAKRSLELNGGKDPTSYMLLTEAYAKAKRNPEAAQAAKDGLAVSDELQQKTYFENRIRELEDTKPAATTPATPPTDKPAPTPSKP
jgi:thiol-disulfide isomerase/thioredoxin